MLERDPGNVALDKYTEVAEVLCRQTFSNRHAAHTALVGLLDEWTAHLQIRRLSAHDIGEPDLDRIVANCRGIEELPVKAGSPTKAVPGYNVMVLDDEGKEVGPHTEGNIDVKLPLPPGTLPTLWKNDKRFVESYMTTFPGYYETSDGGYIDEDGYVYVMGRMDDVINIAGHRLSTGAMEEVLSGHADVAECAVIGVADALKGQMPLGLHRIKDDWYAMEVADASLHFIREDDKVVALELAQNSMLQRAAKTSDTAAALAKTAVEMSREELAAFVGVYRMNPSIDFTIRLGDETLEAMLTGQAFFPVFARGDDKFFYKVVDAELHFERDEEGNVNALVLHQGGIVQRAERVD